MTLIYVIDLDIIPLDPHAEIHVCLLYHKIETHTHRNTHYVKTTITTSDLTLIRFCGVRADPRQIKTACISQQDMIRQRFFR